MVDSTPPARTRRGRTLVTSLCGIAVVAAIMTGCGEETPTEYGVQVRSNFLDQCIGEVPEDASGQSSELRELRDECECMYESISSNLTFTEFQDLDAEVRADQVGLPDRVNDLLVRCVIDA